MNQMGDASFIQSERHALGDVHAMNDINAYEMTFLRAKNRPLVNSLVAMAFDIMYQFDAQNEFSETIHRIEMEQIDREQICRQQFNLQRRNVVHYTLTAKCWQERIVRNSPHV